MDAAHNVLKDVFGFSSFRLSQEAVISRLLVDNENALVVFPTGGGKSLTYQVPALCLPGITLVISPLIALMKDQVDALVKRGVKAANLDSTLTADRATWVKNEVLSGSMKILYVAPERLNNEGFINMMSRVKISLLAVDEAHCISQWGASFRPEYLKIARFAEEQDVERVLCLTATATNTVSDDICKSFYIQKDGIFSTPVFRPNLSLQVQAVSSLDEKLVRLIALLTSRTGPAIVYVTLQKHAEDVARRLASHGLQPSVYHAGLAAEERDRVQTNFMNSDAGIVVCTIAFGMGIDKSNIRQIIHLYMPKTLENYSQEVGRAGRDGLPSTCLLFLCAEDIPILEGFCRGDTCAITDLQLWLQEVAFQSPQKDGSLDFSLYEQSKTHDIRMNVLGLLYAQLELDYKCIRAVTPFFSVFNFALASNGHSKITSDKSSIAQAIRSSWYQKGAKYEINVVSAATRSGVDRSDIARQLNNWELDGLIVDCKASQVRARYVLLENPLPKTPEEIEKVGKELHARMKQREEEAIEKLRQVLDFATDDDCLAHNLSKHFGNDDAVPDGMCTNCTFCMTGQSVEFKYQRSSGNIDPVQIQAILNACPERDDPRLLARMAFGITSPRLTALKCSSYHPLFGSMVSSDFDALVAAFDKECAKEGYRRSETVQAKPSQKRTYTQTSSYSHKTTSGRGRGGSSKRARR